MIHFIKCFSKVQMYGVCLMLQIHIEKHVLDWFTWSASAYIRGKSVTEIEKNIFQVHSKCNEILFFKTFYLQLILYKVNLHKMFKVHEISRYTLFKRYFKSLYNFIRSVIMIFTTALTTNLGISIRQYLVVISRILLLNSTLVEKFSLIGNDKYLE